jgi:hypothetical protein
LAGLGAARVFGFDTLIDLSEKRRRVAVGCVVAASWQFDLCLEVFGLVITSPWLALVAE